MNDYLRPEEVAKIFGVSPKTVSRWTKEGKLKSSRTLGNHRRFLKSDVEKLYRESQS